MQIEIVVTFPCGGETSPRQPAGRRRYDLDDFCY